MIALRSDEDNWPRLTLPNVSSAERLPISYDTNLNCIEHVIPLIPSGPIVEILEIAKCSLVTNFRRWLQGRFYSQRDWSTRYIWAG